jgi:hypothetical protein
MNGSSSRYTRRIRVYALATLPFVAAFTYQLAVVWPTRPATPDVAKGFVIQTMVNNQTLYVSSFDVMLLVGTLAVGAVIVSFGLWRSRPRPSV